MNRKVIITEDDAECFAEATLSISSAFGSQVTYSQNIPVPSRGDHAAMAEYEQALSDHLFHGMEGSEERAEVAASDGRVWRPCSLRFGVAKRISLGSRSRQCIGVVSGSEIGRLPVKHHPSILGSVGGAQSWSQ